MSNYRARLSVLGIPLSQKVAGGGTPEVLVDFSASPVSTGQYSVVSFTTILDPSVLANYSFWDFGDGFYSYELNPQHVYKRAGAYTITLTVITTTYETVTIAKPEYIIVEKSIETLDNVSTLSAELLTDSVAFIVAPETPMEKLPVIETGVPESEVVIIQDMSDLAVGFLTDNVRKTNANN